MLSKAVVFVALTVLVLKKMNKNDLPCPMRFRVVSKFQLSLSGRGNFPIHFEVYRVPVSKNWRRESYNCDS